jgi:hypothetical protein
MKEVFEYAAQLTFSSKLLIAFLAIGATLFHWLLFAKLFGYHPEEDDYNKGRKAIKKRVSRVND